MLYPVELRALHATTQLQGVVYLQKYGRGGRIRTADPLLPKQLRYQAALHPDGGIIMELRGPEERGSVPGSRLESLP